MEDDYEDFVPLMKKRTSKPLSSESVISFSQRSTFSSKQLSLKCFMKPKSDLFSDTRSECFSLPERSVRISNVVAGARNSDRNSKTASPKKKLTSKETFQTFSKGFCPTCQVPFDIVNVLPGVHAASCNVSWTDLEDCPFGEECTALEALHYRDYSHQKLAQVRSSKEESSATPCKQVKSSESSLSGLESLESEWTPRKKKVFRKKINASSGSPCKRPKSSVSSLSVLESPVGKLWKEELSTRKASVACSKLPVSLDSSLSPVKEFQAPCSSDMVKSLNFSGNVLYKEDSNGSLRKQHCIKSSTMPCEECSNCKFPSSPPETSVEMILFPPADTCDPSSKTPVKVNLTYNELGWQSMGVDMQSQADLEEIAVAVCDCAHCIQMECTIKDSSRSKCVRNLEQKLFVNLEDLGVSTPKKDMPSVINKHVTIVSSLKPDGGSSTKLNISNEIGRDEHLETEQVKHVANQSAKVQWKELMTAVKSKGYNTMSIMSQDSLTSSSSGGRGKKQCPFYKRIPDTSFVVDAFQYGTIPMVTHYFLSHFHADHYGGLRKSFSKPIICSAITARLVKKKLGVDSCYLNVIELDQPLTIRQVTVTALDANHCPGSLMFLFQLVDGRNFLHVGDFRADPSMESYPCFWNLTIDILFLDTTYCDPKYTFPTQGEIIGRVVQLCRQHLETNPATLIVSGTYTIGKEKVFLGVAEALDLKIWAKKDKRVILELLQDPSLSARLVDNPWEGQVHVWSMMDIKVQSLKHHVQQCQGKFQEVVAFKPTGWELKMSGDPLDFKSYSSNGVTVYSVPYSEHSSFTELRRFVQFLKPTEIIPTVNMGSASSRASMQRHFKKWLSECENGRRLHTHRQKQLTSFMTVT